MLRLFSIIEKQKKFFGLLVLYFYISFDNSTIQNKIRTPMWCNLFKQLLLFFSVEIIDIMRISLHVKI